MSGKNIYQRIAQVQRAVSKVAKDTTVQAGGQTYRAVSHDAVLSVIREAVVEAGIVVSPSQVGKGEIIQGETKSGGYKHRFEAIYRVDFINIDAPEDRHSVEIEAHADDNGDKAPGKAISYATKTAELKVFLLATGENDEERMEEGHYGKRPQPKAPSTPAAPTADRQAVNDRIRHNLWGLGFTTKEAAGAKVKEMTTFTKDGKTVAGKDDYRALSDKAASLLADKLDKMLTDSRASKEPEICGCCNKPIVALDGRCPDCDGPF